MEIFFLFIFEMSPLLLFFLIEICHHKKVKDEIIYREALDKSTRQSKLSFTLGRGWSEGRAIFPRKKSYSTRAEVNGDTS